MSRLEPRELIQARKLVEEANYHEALSILGNFEELKNLTRSNLLSFRLLKSSILNYIGSYKAAFICGEKAYQLSQDLKSDLQSIDALVNMCFALIMELSMDKAYDLFLRMDSFITCIKESSSVIKQKQASIDHLKGLYYLYKNDAENAIKYSEQSLKLREELGNKHEISEPLNVLGLIYTLLKYDYDLAKAYIERGQRYAVQFNQKHIITYNLLVLGVIYASKGDLKEAIKYFKQSLAISEEIKNKRRISSLLNNIAMAYQKQGKLEKSLEYLEKALALAKEISSPWNIGMSYASIVYLYIEKNDKQNAQKYLELLKSISEKEEYEIFEVWYRLCKALILKMTGRTRDRAKAEELLKEIAEEEIIMSEATILALINLSDLLIKELNTTNDEGVLEELMPFIEKLINIAESSHSFWILAETYLIRAKLSLVLLDLKGARQFLTQAQKVAESHGLQQLAIKISSEHDFLLNELYKWQQLKRNDALLNERIELARLTESSNALMLRRAIEPPKLQEDQPILLIILTKAGKMLLSKFFTSDIVLDDTHLGEFLASFNMFCDEIFSEMFDRVKFGDFTVLINAVDSFTVCYVFQGQTYSARLKLTHFSGFIIKDFNSKNILDKASESGNVINLNENVFFEELINNCFLSELRQFQLPFKAYKGEEPFVFISYSHTDKLQVYPIIKCLNEKGIKIWYDEGIPISEDWRKFIVENIERCKIFLVFITPHIINSETIRKEINFALKRKKKFFAIFLKGTELPSDLEFEIAHIQYIKKFLMSETEFYSKLIEMLNFGL